MHNSCLFYDLYDLVLISLTNCRNSSVIYLQMKFIAYLLLLVIYTLTGPPHV